jgi:hypothetical protein
MLYRDGILRVHTVVSFSTEVLLFHSHVLGNDSQLTNLACGNLDSAGVLASVLGLECLQTRSSILFLTHSWPYVTSSFLATLTNVLCLAIFLPH